MRRFLMLSVCCCMLVLLASGTAWADITETFDDYADTTYGADYGWTSGSTGIMWETYNAMRETTNVHTAGGVAVRLNDDSSANEYLECQGTDGNGKDGGIGTVTFWYRTWDGDGSPIEFVVQYDDGSGYVDAGPAELIDPNSTDWFQYSLNVNVTGDDIMLRIAMIQDAERLIIDDMYIGDYTGGGPTNTPLPTNTPAPTATPTTPPTTVTIYDIQYTTDPSGDSPYVGQTVITNGIVTAFEDGDRNMYLQDGTGAWNGVMMYNSSGWTGYAEGDELDVTTDVNEYNGVTQLTNCVITVATTGNPLPALTVVTSDGMNNEMYEGVLCEIQNAIVTTEENTYNEWNVSDGSGNGLIDDQYTYTYVPTLNDVLDFVRGPVHYAYGSFRMFPRYDADIQLSTAPTATPTTGPTETPVPTAPAVVINEVYYDDPSTDDYSFVELYGPVGASLDGFVIMPRNQTCTDNTGAAIDLSGYTIPTDQYFVVGATGVAEVDLVDDSLLGSLQNGPCDAVWLVYYGTDHDGIRYGTDCDTAEPASCGEGDSMPEPDADHSLGRSVDGVDTDDNLVDFCWNVLSPGTSNTCYVPPTATPTVEPTATPTTGPTATPTTEPTATPTSGGPTATPTTPPIIPTTGPVGLGLLLLGLGALLGIGVRRK